jgi:hypothetical protein
LLADEAVRGGGRVAGLDIRLSFDELLAMTDGITHTPAECLSRSRGLHKKMAVFQRMKILNQSADSLIMGSSKTHYYDSAVLAMHSGADLNSMTPAEYVIAFAV